MLEATRYIKLLTITDSLNEKKAIIREAAVEGCAELFEGYQLAYTKRRDFGVKKVPFIEGEFADHERQELSKDFNWPEFLTLVKQLETRQLTGKMANQALHDAAQVACIEDWNKFYRCILLKNMKCGVRETTVNKVLQEMGGEALQYITPTWTVQKADKATDVSGKKAVDPLITGTRLLTVLDIEAGLMRSFTANGKSTEFFSKILSGLEALLPIMPIGLVLDGVVADERYALFDLIPLDDFDAGICNMTQMDRHDGLVELQGLLQEHTDRRVYVVPKLMVDLDVEEDQVKLDVFGPCVIKDPEAPYVGGVSQHWLERKVFPVEGKNNEKL